MKPDEAEIRRFCTLIHEHICKVANGADGVMQIYRVHPDREDEIQPARFAIGDIDALEQRVIADSMGGYNVFLEPRLVSPKLRGNRRGKIADTVLVYGLVIDSDADKGKAGKVIGTPSFSVETSPDNYQYWYLNNLKPDVARLHGAKLRKESGADSDTGTVTQGYRIPGTINWLNRSKRKRGRTEISLARFVTAQEGKEKSIRPVDLLPADLMELIRDGVEEGERSQAFHGVVRTLMNRGWNEEEIAKLLEEYPEGIGAKYADRDRGITGAVMASVQNLEADDRDDEETEDAEELDADELRERRAKVRSQVQQKLVEFNEKYYLVNENGKAFVFSERYDPILKRWLYVRMSTATLKTLYENQWICTGITSKGKRIRKKLALWWLGHKDRRQYLDGVTFDPSTLDSPEGMFNLWRGFQFEPKQGSWKLMRSHIYNNICSSNKVCFDYLMGWLARMFQFPAERAEVALALRGDQGTGKGIFGHTIRNLFGQHAVYITSGKHLTGNFNAHLRDCVFLFADEAFYAGDKREESTLKGLITDPIIMIEPKGVDPAQVHNMLHIYMASNKDWVVPAGIHERRYFMLDVSDEHAQDKPYFAALAKELEAGGYAAMLYDLLHYDLTGFEIRSMPKTKALTDQKKRSLEIEFKWWAEVLHRGYLYKSKLGLEEQFERWTEFASFALLYESYEQYRKNHGNRYPLSQEQLIKFLTEYAGALSCRPGGQHPVGERMNTGSHSAEVYTRNRPQSYRFGLLREARRNFDTKTVRHQWPKEEPE